MLVVNSPIIIYPRINSSVSNPNGAGVSVCETGSAKFKNMLAHDSFSRVNFKGFIPSAHNAKSIEDSCKLIRNLAESPLVGRKPKIAIVAHSGPDVDAFCSPILLKLMIKDAVGADADVIVMKSVEEKFKPFYKQGEVRVVQDALGANASAEAIKNHFGDYDAVFCLDTAEIRLFDKEIYDGIVANASNVVKIDHHPVDSARANEFNYGHMHLVDDSQKSTGQLLMQFVDALGINKAGHKFNKMVELIYTTIQGDTNFLQYADKGVEEDLKLLNPCLSDVGKASIIKQLEKRTPAARMAIDLLNKNMKVADGNKKAVYSILDTQNTNLSIEEIRALMGIAADGMLATNNPHYSIVVARHPESGVFASIRSQNGGNASEIARALGGDGHSHSCRIPFSKDMSPEQAAVLILQQIEKSHAEQRIAC